MCGGDFVLPSVCCCCHLVHWSSAFHEQRPKDLFLFCPWAKNSRCPKGSVYCNGLHNKVIGYSKPATGEAYESLELCDTTLDLPLLLSHSQRVGSWRGRESKVWTAWAASLSLLWGAQEEGMTPLQAENFSSCVLGCKRLQLLQMPFTACSSTHY